MLNPLRAYAVGMKSLLSGLETYCRILEDQLEALGQDNIRPLITAKQVRELRQSRELKTPEDIIAFLRDLRRLFMPEPIAAALDVFDPGMIMVAQWPVTPVQEYWARQAQETFAYMQGFAKQREAEDA